MKRFWYFFWYAAALAGLVGLWAGWSWFSDPWFPMFCIAMAQVVRLRSGLPETFLDKTFQSNRAEKLAVTSILVIVVGVSGWAAYLKYVWGPENERQGVQEYLDARAKKLEEERGK